MLDLRKDGDVFVLTMDAGENRWNTTFVRAFGEKLDEIEASEGPAALLITSSNEKFFSNGIDLDWVMKPEDHPEGGDRAVFGKEYMALMGRIITFPMPTLVAINGHGFGAGLMLSMCVDVRFMRADRGFVCANEIQIGMKIPSPEIALFKHKMSASAFFETVQLAKRWSGPAAVEAGFVQAALSLDELLPKAMEEAARLAPLGANRERYGDQKEQIFGENAILNSEHGAAYLLKNSEKY